MNDRESFYAGYKASGKAYYDHEIADAWLRYCRKSAYFTVANTRLKLACEFLAGTSIDDAAIAMVSIAQKHKMPLFTKFNGVELIAFPDSDTKGLIESYYTGLKKEVEVT